MNFESRSEQSNSSDAHPLAALSGEARAAEVVEKMATGGVCEGRNWMSPGKLVFLAISLLLLLLDGRSSISLQANPFNMHQAQSADTTRLKSSISQLLQSYKPAMRTLKERALLGAAKSNIIADSESYKCARYCTCSVIQVIGRASKSNLTQASCESPLFADVLTIDQRTQVIHISLPTSEETSIQESASNDEPIEQQSQAAFRMPRLAHFDILREIVIVNLKLEVCDSEVFKRGHRLRRFQLNRNQLRRISKACLRHLEKLRELNLDYNELAELESALFSNLLSLKTLSIAHNRLSELAAHQFANLTNLVSLNLIGNSFKTINLHLLEPMEHSLRLLLLARNQIKSFVYTPSIYSDPNPQMTTNISVSRSKPFPGVLFRHLMKLNIDRNRVERIKLLQLHRFPNVKFLSVRHNNLATIRDKAFNGLKLIELNLDHNQLQSVSKCAFCNATIKRILLAHNNITVSAPGSTLLDSASSIARPQALLSTGASNQTQPELFVAQPPPSSGQNMLILSQSIFGPLFDQLEYLDLSYNQWIADQLDFLLEPLLMLEYLNLAAVGLDRSLPSADLFKNLRQLRYLNLSHNRLDQIISETFEPLGQLEVLDLSHNKFSELEESFFITLDDLSALKLINLASNPWYCSQCKVAPLYDWILRSPIYNRTCISPASQLNSQSSTGEYAIDGIGETQVPAHDYSSLVDDDDKFETPIDFNLVLGGTHEDNIHLNAYQSADYLHSWQVASPRELSSTEDDLSIAQTMDLTASGASVRHNPYDYCLKCEFPRELHTNNIHDLSSADFKFCAGAAPRFAASEPKIGLTLAIVIIGVLLCVIIVVILMYRRKTNAYYTHEDLDHLNATSGGLASKKQLMSISSEAEHQYDNTDYSSPPMSQSYESYSQYDEDEGEDEEFESEEEEDEELEAEADRGRLAELDVQQLATGAHRPTRPEVESIRSAAENSPTGSSAKESSRGRRSSSSLNANSLSQVRSNTESQSSRFKHRRQPSQSGTDTVPTPASATKALWADPIEVPVESEFDHQKDQSAPESETGESRTAKTNRIASQSLSLASSGRSCKSKEMSEGEDLPRQDSERPPEKVPTLDSRKQTAPQASRTLSGTAPGLQARDNPVTRSQSSGGSSGGRRFMVEAGSRRPNFSKIGRRRLQLAKEVTSGTFSDCQLPEASRGSSENLLKHKPATHELSKRGELQQMAHLVHLSRSPSALSDATTADSLALEALEFAADLEAAEDEELPAQLGGALEMDESSLEPALGLELQHNLLQPDEAGQQHERPSSTHSALTQTGSRELEDL